MAHSNALARGRSFVRHVMLLTVAVAFGYVFLHVAITPPAPSDAPGCNDPPTWHCFAAIDALGDLHFVNARDAAWFVGQSTALHVRHRAEANARVMDELRQRIAARVGAQIAPLLIDRAPADALRRQLASGRYDEAIDTYDTVVASLSTGSANGSALELSELGSDLDRLGLLRRDQQSLVEQLSPPTSLGFLWITPGLSLLEAFFWALFGVSTSLLVHATEGLRRGEFHPSERWVGYAKLLYGPIFAVAIVIAMLNGILRPESVEVRVWTLPGVSFVFGFASRRMALAFDRLLERVLGPSGKSIHVEPDPALVKRRELIDKLMLAYRPGDLVQFRRQSKELASELVEAEVAAREES